MRLLYLVSVAVHVLAATVWVGALFFVALVVVPWLRRGGHVGSVDAGSFLGETGERLRTIGWICFALLLVTGTFNLWYRGVRLAHVLEPGWWASGFGGAVGLKLSTFVLVVGLSAVHDFRIGPRATEAMRREPDAPRTVRLRRAASLLGRLNGLLAVVLVALGVVIVRGWP